MHCKNFPYIYGPIFRENDIYNYGIAVFDGIVGFLTIYCFDLKEI